MRMMKDDWGSGVDDNAGSPKTLRKTWLDINWVFPANAVNPSSFTVVAVSGIDPSDTSTYLFDPVTVPGTDRRLVISISPNVDVTNVNAAVRSEYV